jgi:hypothetical protein
MTQDQDADKDDSEEIPPQAKENREAKALEEQLHRLTQKRKVYKEFLLGYRIVSALLGFAGIVFEVARNGVHGWIWESFRITAWVFFFIFLSSFVNERGKLREVEDDIEQISFQKDMVAYGLHEREIMAEKLLRINDFQLRRYYDLNLRQNRWVFGLGVGCIVVGVLIIAATIYALNIKSTDLQTKQITAVLGAVSAILTNFIAAIFLKMNAGANESLTAFHSKLVATHQVMIGNLLASRIENTYKREETLAALALKLVPSKDI